MADHHLAQLNIARMKYAFDAPAMADFVARLEDINALADESPGFVWRLQTDEGDATAIDFFGPDLLVNLSVWRDVESLRDYAFRSAHREVLAQRHRWFERMQEAYAVLWWIPAGSIPTLEEAAERLDYLRRDGPGPGAFTFSKQFAPE
ncbi:MAG: DUF3291 domain-containing protein [Gammaproteobacteria bacterium]|nr:DUF3291 domain-containing protein [Gammaproteobacteria bacterium]